MKLLVVIGAILTLVVGIIAVLPVPTAGARWQYHLTSMRSDLRNMVSAQESYLVDSGTYAAQLPSNSYAASTGVTVTVVEASDSGWRGVATRADMPMECRIYVGKVTARPVTIADTVAAEAEPACWGLPYQPYKVTWRMRLGLQVRHRSLPQDSLVGSY